MQGCQDAHAPNWAAAGDRQPPFRPISGHLSRVGQGPIKRDTPATKSDATPASLDCAALRAAAYSSLNTVPRLLGCQTSAMNPIIFLDFDGVTHPEGCRAQDLFCKMPLIESVLLRHPNVHVVISSSWREHRPLQLLQQHFSLALRQRVVGCTPVVRQDPCEPTLRHIREMECKSWLQGHRPEILRNGHWLAMDDAPWLFSRDCEQLLQTNPRSGFAEADQVRLERHIQRWS